LRERRDHLWRRPADLGNPRTRAGASGAGASRKAMIVRLDVIWHELPQFAAGLGNTIWLCAASMILSLLLGGMLMAPLMSRHRVVRAAARALIDGGRCVPFLLLAYLVYFALPTL